MDFWTDASWFPQQIDVFSRRTSLVRLEEADYRASVFLDQRLAVQQPRTRIESVAPLAEAAAQHRAAAGWVFHVGHCGSTLLSRVLQDATTVLPLREPVPLRALSSAERDLDQPLSVIDVPGYRKLQTFLLSAYARRFPRNELALVKPTSSCCNLLAAALAAHGDSRAVFLYLPLESFLATLLRSDLRRQETCQFGPSRLADFHRLSGDATVRLYDLSIGELTAMSWAANMLWERRVRHEAGNRLLAVNFEQMLDDPVTVCGEIAAFLALDTDAALLDVAWRRVTAGYSKDPQQPYSRQTRDAELDRCRRTWQAEIEQGLAWVAARRDHLEGVLGLP